MLPSGKTGSGESVDRDGHVRVRRHVRRVSVSLLFGVVRVVAGAVDAEDGRHRAVVDAEDVVVRLHDDGEVVACPARSSASCR